MRKSILRAVSALVAVLIVISMMPTGIFAAEAEMDISASTVSGCPGETVTVTVKLSNNPGIASLKFNVNYNEEYLTLNSVAFGEEFGVYVTAPEPYQSPQTISFVSPLAPVTANGLFASLNFGISPNAPDGSSSDITIAYDEDDVFDSDYNNVKLKITNGKVNIHTGIPGDIDGDKKVNNKDAVLLFQYTAGWSVTVDPAALDVTGDGKINNRDAITLFRHVSGWPEEITGPLHYGLICQHELQPTEAVAATCTKPGSNAYWYCDICGKYFSDANATKEVQLEDTVIPALGHTPVIDPAVPATATSTGLTEGSHCSVCLVVITPQEVTPVLEPNTANVIYKLVNESKDPYLAQQTIQNSNPSTYKIGEGITLSNDITVAGYTFVGWFDSFDDNATQIKEISATSTKDVTLYAHWKEIPYKITYNLYQTPVTSSPSAEQLEYTVNKGNYNLYNPEINNYKFLGWYDDNGVEYKNIPVGTTGNITLHAYYTSLRNLAISKEDNNPIILEDRNNNVVYFTYEIGEIRNIPLNGDKPFWTIQSVAGLSQQVSETYTTTITASEASSVSKTISDMTVKSNTWTLSESWNNVTSVSESWAKSIGKTAEQCKAESTTSSNTLSISDQMGGSSYHKTEDGTTVYDYDSKTETKDKGHEFNASLSGTYSNKISANVGNSTEFGTENAYSATNGYTAAGKSQAGNWSASGSQSGSSTQSDKDKFSAGIGYENGFEINAGLAYGYHNNTNTVTKTGSDSVTVNSKIDENTSSWNSSATMSATNQRSTSTSVRNTLSDIITTTKEYGSSYSNGGSDTNTQGFSSTASNTSGTTSTVTYSKLESKTKTTTYGVDGKIEGTYRCILVGMAHVFGVVGYDYNTKSYFTYTFSVMDDETQEFLDYTPKGGDFTDCENSCLPFEIPSDVFDYVNERTVKTSGVLYRTDSVNGTAKITGYSDSESDVVIPSYVSDGKQAYKVTEIASTAFAGKPVRTVVLGEFIKAIPDGAFKNCTNLESVIGSFTEIGDEAFAGCVNLTSMNIPSNVVKIGENAFSGVNSINVRAINSFCAYTEAVEALPNGVNSEDAEIEAKQKEITQQFIASVLESGAENITLDISKIGDGTQLTLEVPAINSIEINGGGKSFYNFSIKSDAKNTAMTEITIQTANRTPISVGSDNLTLHKAFVSGNSTAVILKKDGAVLSLSQDSSVSSTAQYTVIGKNPDIKGLKSTDNAVGYLRVVGNLGYVNSIRGEEYIEFSDGSLEEISDEEFERYVKGSCDVALDANEGLSLIHISEPTRPY